MDIQRPISSQFMPENAKKAFSGVIFDVYQWEQKLYDGSTETFEKLKRVDTVMTVPITDEGKFILTKQEQPGKDMFIGLAGGRLEQEESPVEGAKRELLEETGMVASSFELISAIQPISKIDWAVYTFIAKGCKRVQDLELDAGEKIDLLELDFDEFIDHVCHENFADIELSLMVLRTIRKPNGVSLLREKFSN
ncbi:NUDIX hydrolase [Candidatus Dojkabacteria bacterium]|uniref:NUDIX hydrolase n=1 Tax=Candidatus Dojkabacteria bacterium TaxID=2099670 RepID=A0A955L8U4_9BACT|nr:NUDIX hydrolase [Candidatus Dojkabacteria bacterium]